MAKAVSIVVRSKNEEKWISSCLDAIFRQTFRDFEVILVDNGSADRTLEKAGAFDVEIISIDEFLPGLALNKGIRASTGHLIACISAHCIPVNEHWLENLVRNLEDVEVAGVYGRQEPLSFTDPLDKRDLINLFGLDKKIQKKDPFFHNANSMIRRAVWEKYPFDEKVTNIEDRVWAQQVLKAGYKIIYEPEARVYHYHGIHQGRNTERAQSVVRVLEQIHPLPQTASIQGLNVAAIIPVSGEMKMFNGKPLLARAIASAQKSNYISRVVVASDNPASLNVAKEMGAEGILRPKGLSGDFIGVEKAYQYALEQMMSQTKSLPDFLVLLEETYPFRPPRLIDDMIETFLHADYDTIIAAHPEYNSMWKKNGADLVRVDAGTMPTKFKEPVYIGAIGLATVTHPNIVLEGERLGSRLGLVSVDNPFSAIKISDEIDLLMAEAAEAKWIEFQKKDESMKVKAR